MSITSIDSIQLFKLLIFFYLKKINPFILKFDIKSCEADEINSFLILLKVIFNLSFDIIQFKGSKLLFDAIMSKFLTFCL